MARAPRRISAVYLFRVTGHYLERYSSSRANLRRLLQKRVRRSAAHHGEDEGPWMALVEAELDRLERMGLLNDRQYATDRARTLHRRGSGSRKIRATLAAKGVGSDQIDLALAALTDEGVDPDVSAACIYARKRAIGPWRRTEVDRVGRNKELARLARAGFSFDIARRVVDAETAEEIEWNG